MDLDEKNKILFEHLLKYARFSVKDLARVLKVSKATIIKRIKFLEENDYISRYDAIVNWQKILLIKKTYFVKVSNKEEFEKKMVSEKPVFAVVELTGFYNYYIWCFFKTKKQEKEFERNLKNYEKEEVEIKELIFPKVTFFDVPIKIPLPKIEDKEIKLNKTCIEIMKYMAQGHGRDSLYEISDKINRNYDSVNYQGNKILKNNYFESIIAQPGTSQFTLQTTCLVIYCKDKKSSEELHEKLKNISHVQSNAICENNKIMVHILNQTHVEYRETLSKIIDLVPKDKMKNILILYWKNPFLINRYPLEYLLKK